MFSSRVEGRQPSAGRYVNTCSYVCVCVHVCMYIIYLLSQYGTCVMLGQHVHEYVGECVHMLRVQEGFVVVVVVHCALWCESWCPNCALASTCFDVGFISL